MWLNGLILFFKCFLRVNYLTFCNSTSTHGCLDWDKTYKLLSNLSWLWPPSSENCGGENFWQVSIIFQVSTTKLMTPTIAVSCQMWVGSSYFCNVAHQMNLWQVGGSLGLWLGLGVLQVTNVNISKLSWLICCQQELQEMITKVLPIFRKCRNLGRNVQI